MSSTDNLCKGEHSAFIKLPIVIKGEGNPDDYYVLYERS